MYRGFGTFLVLEVRRAAVPVLAEHYTVLVPAIVIQNPYFTVFSTLSVPQAGTGMVLCLQQCMPGWATAS